MDKINPVRDCQSRYSAWLGVAASVSALAMGACNGSFSANFSGFHSANNAATGTPAPSASSAEAAPAAPPAATTAKALVPAAAVAATPPAPVTECDIHKVDWKNYAFTDYKLKDGTFVAHLDGCDDCDGYGSQIEASKIVYGDLNKNSKPEAYVPVSNHSPTAEDLDLWVFENDADCHPQVVFKSTHAMMAHGGSIVSGSYVYLRQPDFNDPAHWQKVEVRPVNGHFIEAKLTPAPPPKITM